MAMDGPAYADSILGRKVAACVALAAVALYWHGFGLVMVVGMTKWRADLWRVRPFRLSGFVVVLLTGLKPCEMMAMPNANQFGGELRDDRAPADLRLPPRRRGRHPSQRAPVAPAVNVVEGKIVLL
jgi:hypothetical protein